MLLLVLLPNEHVTLARNKTQEKYAVAFFLRFCIAGTVLILLLDVAVVAVDVAVVAVDVGFFLLLCTLCICLMMLIQYFV